jgi:hypothetical protein
MALFLAMVLALVSGAWTGTTLGKLAGEADHGLAGASAERGSTEALPSAKPSGEEASESNESRSEREAEDGEELTTAWLPRTAIDIQPFAHGAAHEVDGTSTMRAWLLLASIGARGPPVG